MSLPPRPLPPVLHLLTAALRAPLRCQLWIPFPSDSWLCAGALLTCLSSRMRTETVCCLAISWCAPPPLTLRLLSLFPSWLSVTSGPPSREGFGRGAPGHCSQHCHKTSSRKQKCSQLAPLDRPLTQNLHCVRDPEIYCCCEFFCGI